MKCENAKKQAALCGNYGLPFLTESYGLQLLQVDRQLERGGLALTAPAGQRRGQAGGGRAQEWILQEEDKSYCQTDIRPMSWDLKRAARSG